jgi:hypothetical protein
VNQIKEHIICKFSIVILVIALLTPSFVKFFHVFENHSHQVCKNNQKTHFHEFDLDCEFYKFKLNTKSSPLYQAVDLLNIEDNFLPISSKYQLAKSNTLLYFSLRAPPELA